MRLALGTVQFGLPYGIANQSGQVTRPIAKAMLKLAEANGIDTLDTAINYGESESCLGVLGTQGFKLVTKLPAVPEGCSEINDWVCFQVEASLDRLGVSTIDGLLLHRPHQLLESGGKILYQALQKLKDSGQVKKIGASISAPSELDKLIPRYRFDLIQAPFNLIDRRLEATSWLQRLKDEEIEIHTRSSFLQGLLLMSQDAIPDEFSSWSHIWKKWHEWLSYNEIPAVSACLAYPLSFPEIDRVVVGADSVDHLKQTIKATTQRAPDDFPNIQSNVGSLINPTSWSN